MRGAAAALLLPAAAAATRFPPPPAHTPAPPPSPSGPGCGGGWPDDLSPGSTKERYITVTDPDSRLGLYSREYIVGLPSNYTGKERVPVVLYFHGWCDEWTCSTCKFAEVGNERGYITVKPKGMSDCTTSTSADDSVSWNMERGGDTGICNTKDTTPYQYTSCNKLGLSGPCNSYTCFDDVWFVSELIKALERDLCVDSSRVYGTGSSNGAMFLYVLAAQLVHRNLGPRLASIAPWYGSPFKGQLDVPSGMAGTSIMISHGTKDTEIPYDSRESDDGYFYTPMNESLAAYAKVNGCGTKRRVATGNAFPPPSPPVPSGMQVATTPYDSQSALTTCYEYADCPAGGGVMICFYNAAHGFWEGYSEEMTWWFFSQK